MARLLKNLHHWYDVVAVLVSRDHKSRYKNTAMGVVWAVASPVLFLLTFYLLFGLVMRVDIPNYATFVFIGIVAWQWLQTSLNESVASISQNASLVAYPGFPLPSLPIVSVISNFINFLFAIPVVVLVVLIENGSLGWAVFLTPIVMIVQFVFVLSLVYLVAAANVTFRDTQYILPVLLQLGYFMTPIFYSLDQLPDEFRFILMLNPMAQIISAYRMIFNGLLPDLAGLAWVLGFSIVLLVVTYRYFLRAAEHFLEEI